MSSLRGSSRAPVPLSWQLPTAAQQQSDPASQSWRLTFKLQDARVSCQATRRPTPKEHSLPFAWMLASLTSQTPGGIMGAVFYHKFLMPNLRTCNRMVPWILRNVLSGACNEGRGCFMILSCTISWQSSLPKFQKVLKLSTYLLLMLWAQSK